MSFSTFRFPTSINYGAGALATLESQLTQSHCKRPLIICDRNLKDLPPMVKLIDTCDKAKLSYLIDNHSYGNPTHDHVVSGVESFRKHDADSIIMIGGGCALDVGKAVALMVHHPGHLFDYEDGKKDTLPIDAKKLPYTLAIPTTAGTGSEVGGSSVISCPKTHRKIIIWGEALLPKKVIADPELTLSLPPNLTAATGIDALTHNLEAFLAKGFHPLCDAIALQGIQLAYEHLEKAVDEPTNLESRSNMLMSSMMGAIAFQKGLGVTHSCAHALSTHFDLHHGLANGLMLNVCMKFNDQFVPERFLTISKSIGMESKDDFFSWLFELPSRIDLPRDLNAVGVSITDELITSALNDPCHQNNPVPCTRETFISLFQDSLKKP